MSDPATNPAEGGDAPSEEEVVDPAEGQGEGAETETDGEGPEDGEGDGQPEDEDTEEFEHDGQKYALPKALKSAVMRQADYTQKTQALAEQKRTFDAERAQFAEAQKVATEAEEAIVDARAAVKSIDKEAASLKTAIAEVEAELANVDFAALARMENGEVLYRQREQYLRQLQMAQNKLADERTKLAGDLDAKVKARDDAKSKHALEQQQATAKLFEDRDAALSAKFPKWSEEFPQIQAFVTKTFGIPAEDVKNTPNAALLEIARYAKLGYEAEQRGKTTAAAQKRIAPATGAGQPVKRVVPTGSPPKTDPNRMSTEQWMAHRRGQLAKKGGR